VKDRPFVVAIDGPAAAGKGTLARRLAAHFGFAYLDTGRLYRATALILRDEGSDPAAPAAAAAAARRLEPGMLADPRLGDEAIGAAASRVAAMPDVREALLALQRDFAARPPPPAKGAVLDGRDIGSVVCPAADLKLYVTASAPERARRRLEELRQAGAPAIYEDVLQDINQRDARDRERPIAPLVAPPDAVIIDTTGLDAVAVFARAVALVAQVFEEKVWPH
jgi:cytidylate kinase